MGFPLFNYLILTHCKVFWIFLLLSQTEHLKSLQWEYHVASYNSHYFSLFHFAEFCFYLSGHFLETLLNYLPAESSQFGVLCSFFDWCIFLTVFLVYWVFFVFVFFSCFFLSPYWGLYSFMPICSSFAQNHYFLSQQIGDHGHQKNLSMLWRLCFVFLTPPPFRLWFTTTVLGVLGFIQPWEWQWITCDVKQVRLNLTMLHFGNYKPQTPLMDI